MSITQRDESVAIDIVYSDTPAIDNGCKRSWIFVSVNMMLTDVYGMRTDSQFVDTFEDCIRDRGAISQLIRDLAQVDIRKRVLDIIRALCIG